MLPDNLLDFWFNSPISKRYYLWFLLRPSISPPPNPTLSWWCPLSPEMIRKAFLGIPIVPELAHTLSVHRGIVYKANPSVWPSLSSGRAPWNCALSLLHQYFSLPESSFPWAYKCLKSGLFAIPWTAACQAPLSFTVSWNSNSCPLSWWCYLTISSSTTPFSFCFPSFPASGSFPVSWPFLSGGIGVSASASVLVWSPCSPRGSQEFSPAQSKSINSSALSFLIIQLSHLYMTTGKTIALTIQTFVGKVVSLLFDILSRFIMGLPRWC